jgi:hypothetical protein
VESGCDWSPDPSWARCRSPSASCDYPNRGRSFHPPRAPDWIEIDLTRDEAALQVPDPIAKERKKRNNELAPHAYPQTASAVERLASRPAWDRSRLAPSWAGRGSLGPFGLETIRPAALDDRSCSPYDGERLPSGALRGHVCLPRSPLSVS